jgi:thioredoxin
MKNRRLFLAALCVGALTAFGAHAFQIQPYTQAAAQKAIASGKPVAIEIYASWCPICQAQATVIDSIRNEPAYRDITFFRVDYDAQQKVAEQLHSPRATIIVYRGGKEVARESWGATAEDVMKIMMKAE